MARDMLKKKLRVAHNKADNEDHEMLSEENDFLPGFLAHIRSNDMSALYINNSDASLSETNRTFVKQKTQTSTIPIQSQNRISVPTSTKFKTFNKYPLMEKVARTVKLINHNRQIPKPKAHLATLSNSPLECNSQSSNNNSISLEKSKKTKIVKKDPKNICNSQNKRNFIKPKEQQPKRIPFKNPDSAIIRNSVEETSEKVKNFDKTGDDSSDSDDLYEEFIKKNCPKKSKSEIDNSKKNQKSTKVSKKKISKSTSAASDRNMSDEETTSAVSGYNMSDDESSSESDNETFVSSESGSNLSDDETFASSKSKNQNCKKSNKKYERLNKRQSTTTKRNNASESVRKRNISKKLSKSALPESDYDSSDDETASSKNKNCKKSVSNRRSTTSKRDNAPQSVRKRDNSRKLFKSASQEKVSEMSDKKSSSYNTRSKRTNNHKVLDKRQSITSKGDNASELVRKKRNSRTLSKSVSQENESEMSDNKSPYYTKSKRTKSHKVLENRQSTSKEQSESEMIIVQDDTYDSSSDSGDLPSLSEIFSGRKPNSYTCSGQSSEQSSVHIPVLEYNSSSHNSFGNSSLVVSNKLNEAVSHNTSDTTSVISSDNFCDSNKTSGITSLSANEFKPVFHNKTSHTASSVGSDQQNISHKTLVPPSLVSSAQTNASCKTSGTASLVVNNNPPNVLHKMSNIPSSNKVNMECLAANASYKTSGTASLVINNDPPNVLHKMSNIPSSNKVNMECLADKDSSALNPNSRQENFSNSMVVDLTESDNECETSTAMPKIIAIYSECDQKSQSHSEESDIELVDVIVYDLPEKSKTNCSEKNVKSDCSNDSTVKLGMKTGVDLSCNNAEPQNTSELKTSLNDKYEVVYSTGICQNYDKEMESKDKVISQFNLNKDKPESSSVCNAKDSPISSQNLKKEPCDDDCEIVLDIASTSNQNLPGIQQKYNNKNVKVEKQSKAVEQVAISQFNLNKDKPESSSVGNAEDLLISSQNLKKEPCDDNCETVLNNASPNDSNQNLPGVQQKYNNKNVKVEKQFKAVEQVAISQFNLNKDKPESSSVGNAEDLLISSQNLKKEPCDDNCETVLNNASPNDSNQNLPGVQICSNKNVKVEKHSKVIEQVAPVHVANNGPTATEQNDKLSQKEQKLHKVESSNFENSEQVKTEVDSVAIAVLIEAAKKELATYQEIKKTEEKVQITFQSLERCQTEKLICLQSKIEEYLVSVPGNSDCLAIKKEVNRLLGSSELSSSSSPSLKGFSEVLPICHNISVQDLKTFATMNLVPLSSIPENDIKPNLSELQCPSEQQASTSHRRKSIDRNFSFGQKCMVCAKDAVEACAECCKVFFCSNECGIKYWEDGHKNACKYL